ncbi:MAG: putative UDP-galactopyranose mutase [Homoserinimonas sp.]|nr:putative UDP-galactopyranose mutase [Homoserinimonas sp.]
MTKKIAIAGAGFAGIVIARELALSGKYSITIYEARDHIAGNCHTSRDARSGVMIHHYGPHIFHTSRDDVWRYVQSFGEFGPYTNRVKAVTERGVFTLPVNLLTINQFFGKRFTPAQARAFVESMGDRSITEPQNFEEQAVKFLGQELYRTFFYGYTKKQWGVEPTQLPASILQRLPIRFNYDDNYYNSTYQGIPVDGYTAIAEKMIDHPAIEVRLGQRLKPEMREDYDHVFFSGPMDEYFHYRLGRLRYRSLIFERFEAEGDYQGNAVINYCQEEVPYTRISEHKHFTPWEEHEHTVCFREYSKLTEPDDVPYYPLRLAEDKALLADYLHLAEAEKGVSFIGRLGTYRYLDMHVVIGESLDLARRCVDSALEEWPTFSNAPL